MRWWLLLLLAGCAMPVSAPSVIDAHQMDALIRYTHDEAEQRQAVLALCERGYDLACVKLRHEDIQEYLSQ